MLYFTNTKGEDIKVENWGDFNEVATRMMFQINEKEFIVLEGFEAYLRLKENVKGVMSSVSGVSKVILLGMYYNKVAKVTLDLIHSKVHQEILPLAQAYNEKPLDSRLWKRGVLTSPKVYVK